MPRDSNGVHSLPAGYLAVNGEPVLPSNHNPPLEDVSEALTASLPRNGAAPMTGALKLADGTVSLPGLSFASDPSNGFYKVASGFMAAGLLSAVPIGGGIDFWGTTAPAGWLFPYGQVVSQTTYPALYAALGTTYNTGGESAGTFRLPDKRNMASFGKGDMGGVDRGLITLAGSGVPGATLGAAGGAQTVTLGMTNLPASPAPVGITLLTTLGSPALVLPGGATVTGGGAPGNSIPGIADFQSLTHTANTANLGIATPVNKLPPGIVCNYILFAGA